MRPAPIPLPAQFGPGEIRLVGAAVTGLLVVAVLYLAFWLGESTADDDPVYEDDESEGLPSFGPAYGATGTQDVEEVLQVEDDGTDATSDRRGGRRSHGDTNAAGSETGDRSPEDPGTADDGGALGPESVFSHELLSDRAGELLVAVTDGDRTARFYVEDPDGDPTVSPAFASGNRHDDAWLDSASEYLRSAGRGGALRRDRDRDRETERP